MDDYTQDRIFSPSSFHCGSKYDSSAQSRERELESISSLSLYVKVKRVASLIDQTLTLIQLYFFNAFVRFSSDVLGPEETFPQDGSQVPQS